MRQSSFPSSFPSCITSCSIVGGIYFGASFSRHACTCCSQHQYDDSETLFVGVAQCTLLSSKLKILKTIVSIEIRTHRSFALFEHHCVECIVSILRWPLPLWHSYVLRGLPWCPRICRSRHHNLAKNFTMQLTQSLAHAGPYKCSLWMPPDAKGAGQSCGKLLWVHCFWSRSVPILLISSCHVVSHLRPAPSCSNLWADNFLKSGCVALRHGVVTVS